MPLTGGVLVMASDGLFGLLSSHRILEVVQAVLPAEVPEALLLAVRAANGGRVSDDFPCIAVWEGEA
jgi:serine/threonine protein phosphatase PrpC